MSHCLPVFKPAYCPTSGIYNNDQNKLGCLDNRVNKYPILELAFISNTSEEPKSEPVILNFHPFCLNWCDFIALFFRSPGGAFNINPANSNSKVITFSEQKYSTVNDKIVRFNLADQILKAWAKKNDLPESAVPTQLKIKLNREMFLLKNLGSAGALQIGLSLDEALATLIQNQEIERSDSIDDSAEVHFTISFREYYKCLDVTLLLNFTYITHIPCYKNTGECPPPYSHDPLPARKFLFDDSTIHNDNISVAETKDGDNVSVHEFYNDDHTLVTNSTNMVSEISNIIYGDSKSVGESTKW